MAQNPKIKCYFNHPVNNNIATIAKAVYLNGTFPDTVAAYINKAKTSVDIAQYDFTSTVGDIVSKIATAANNASTRGVVVRWIYNGSSSNTGLKLLNANIKTLASPTTSGYGISHNKFMVVDATATDTSTPIVLTASYDWSVQQTNSDYNNMIILQNKDLAMAYYNEFNKMWGGTASTPNITNSTFGTHKTISAQNIFNVNGTKVELYFSPKDTVNVHLQNTINTVNNELFFGIYTFTDNTIATLIKNKFNGGIKVQGIIDQYSKTYAAYTTLSPVLGTMMIMYSSNYIYHNKIMLVDALHPSSDPQVFTGSFNWSSAAANSNDENAIVIHDASIANQYYQSLCEDYFTLGGTACISPLPIDLLYFNGKVNGNDVDLKWGCESTETNNTYQLERSIDGINYQDLTGNNLVSNDNSIHQYSYTDKNNNYPLTYYRLKIIDNNTTTTYSNTVVINKNLNKVVKLNVYPNPAKDMIHVIIPEANNSISIVNSVGQVLNRIQSSQLNIVDINISNLTKGFYTIMVNNATNSYHQIFVKE